MHGRRGPRPAVLTLPAGIEDQVAAALREDVGSGDLTAALVPAPQRIHGRVITREAAVLCGTAWFDETFHQLDPRIHISWKAYDGDAVTADTVLCELAGPARALLTGERTALNFLQTLSATATQANRYVQAVAGTGCTILDTRKTLPGLRLAQKYATQCGGARNHRIGLYDAILIKENHIAAAGSIAAAVAEARRTAPGRPVEVEVEDLAEFEQALGARPDTVMLDEFSLEDTRAAVARNREMGSPVVIEASGSVTLETIRTIAQTGVDCISVGAITKHVRAIDLSMRLDFSGSAPPAA